MPSLPSKLRTDSFMERGDQAPRGRPAEEEVLSLPLRWAHAPNGDSLGTPNGEYHVRALTTRMTKSGVVVRVHAAICGRHAADEMRDSV